MRADVLASGLDNLYANRAYEIFKKDVATYSKTENLNAIQIQLFEWQNQGYIEILKPLEDCEELEPCIKLLKFIQEK